MEGGRAWFHFRNNILAVIGEISVEGRSPGEWDVGAKEGPVKGRHTYTHTHTQCAVNSGRRRSFRRLRFLV